MIFSNEYPVTPLLRDSQKSKTGREFTHHHTLLFPLLLADPRFRHVNDAWLYDWFADMQQPQNDAGVHFKEFKCFALRYPYVDPTQFFKSAALKFGLSCVVCKKIRYRPSVSKYTHNGRSSDWLHLVQEYVGENLPATIADVMSYFCFLRPLCGACESSFVSFNAGRRIELTKGKAYTAAYPDGVRKRLQLNYIDWLALQLKNAAKGMPDVFRLEPHGKHRARPKERITIRDYKSHRYSPSA